MNQSNFIDTLIAETKESSDGIHAISVVELSSGMSLGSYSNHSIDPNLASAYNAEVVKEKIKAINALGLASTEIIDDILITLSTQYHLINCTKNGSHMIYLAADKLKSNLALLRNNVKKAKMALEKQL